MVRLNSLIVGLAGVACALLKAAHGANLRIIKSNKTWDAVDIPDSTLDLGGITFPERKIPLHTNIPSRSIHNTKAGNPNPVISSNSKKQSRMDEIHKSLSAFFNISGADILGSTAQSPITHQLQTALRQTSTTLSDDALFSYAEEGNREAYKKDVVQFNLSSARSSTPVRIADASLFLVVKYKKKTRDGNRKERRVKITIYNIPEGAHSDRSRASTGSNVDTTKDTRGIRVADLTFVVQKTQWQKLSLPVSMVQDVINSTNGSLQFRVECQNCGNEINPVLVRRRRSGRRTRTGKHRTRSNRKARSNKRRPFLIIKTRPVASRARRGTSGCDSSDTYDERLCSVEPMYLTFSELGWGDWIASPEGFYANYCSGGCHQSHGHCCEAASLSGLDIMQQTSTGLVPKTIGGMIIDACSCL